MEQHSEPTPPTPEARGLKRKLGVCDVSDIKESPNATVDGVLTEVSPVKSSKKNPHVLYFNGVISDGKKTARIVSFDPAMHNTFEQALKNNSSVSLVNCQVRPNMIDKHLEIVATTRSKIETSPRKFTLQPANEQDQATLKPITIAELPTISPNQRVDTVIKVLTVGPPQTVNKRDGTTLMMQECIVADSTGTCRLVLWGDDITKAKQSQSYQMKQLTVRLYKDAKFLSVGTNTAFLEVDDIGDVMQHSENDEDKTNNDEIVGEIDAVLSFDVYYSCMSCKSKLKENVNIAQCPKCNMHIKLSKCKRVSTATIIVGDVSGHDHQLTIFDPLLTTITKSINHNTLPEKLLCCPQMIFKINNRKVVTAVTQVS